MDSINAIELAMHEQLLVLYETQTQACQPHWYDQGLVWFYRFQVVFSATLGILMMAWRHSYLWAGFDVAWCLWYIHLTKSWTQHLANQRDRQIEYAMKAEMEAQLLRAMRHDVEPLIIDEEP